MRIHNIIIIIISYYYDNVNIILFLLITIIYYCGYKLPITVVRVGINNWFEISSGCVKNETNILFFYNNKIRLDRDAISSIRIF